MSEFRVLWDHVTKQRAAGGVAAPTPGGKKPAPKGKDEKAPADAPDPTDASKLFIDENGVSVATDKQGINQVRHPRAGVKYYFCAHVVNGSKLDSGEFFVRFELVEGKKWKKDVKHDGLEPEGTDIVAAKYAETFSVDVHYRIKACIHAKDAPKKPIFCKEFGFPVDHVGDAKDKEHEKEMEDEDEQEGEDEKEEK
jgi:hypothetical protein